MKRIRRPCGLADALVDLAGRLTGPVLDPHGVEALTELAGAGRDGLSRRIAVVGAVDADDVALTLCWASAHRVAVAVPGTGFLGDPSAPTVVVSTSRIDRIRVDARRGTVRAGLGASWAGVTAAARCHGLVAPWPWGGRLADTVRVLGPDGVPGVRAVTVVSGAGVVVEVAPTDVHGVVTGVQLASSR